MTADEKIKKLEKEAISVELIAIHVIVLGGYGLCCFFDMKATGAYFLLSVILTSITSIVLDQKTKYVYTPATLVFFLGIAFSAFLGVPFISVLLISFVSFILTLINFS